MTCDPREALYLADTFTHQFRQNHDPASVIGYGITRKQNHGFVVLEWQDTVPTTFMRQLDEDHEVEHYVIYEVALYYFEDNTPATELPSLR
jgi:hypothetical protein